MTPSFTRATPEDGKVLAFEREVRIRQILTMVEVKVEWINAQEVAAPSEAELN